MNRTALWLPLALLLIAGTSINSGAATLSGRVVGITDGDTIFDELTDETAFLVRELKVSL